MSTQNPIIAVYTRSGYPSSKVKQSIPDYANTNVNTLILSGPNGFNGEIVYNDPPYPMFNSQGQYVGDASWPASLAQLIAETNINPSGIFFSLSNSAISTLAAMRATALANVMTWLKANGITGIDMDCENWGQPGGLNPMDPACQTVTLAAIAAGLALTAAPYNQQNGWQSWCTFVSQHNGSVSWLNVQCYAGGSGNDPVLQWFTQFNPSVPVVAGFEASPGSDAGALTPAQAQTQLAKWQAETPNNSLAGAFVWDFGIITSGTYTVSEFALAMYAALTNVICQQITVPNGGGGVFLASIIPTTFAGGPTYSMPPGGWANDPTNSYVLRFLPNALSVTRIAGSEQVWRVPLQNAAFLDFQADGNLVAYLEDHKTVVWNSGTHGNLGSVLAIQPDSNLVIYRLTAVWSWQTGIIPHAALQGTPKPTLQPNVQVICQQITVPNGGGEVFLASIIPTTFAGGPTYSMSPGGWANDPTNSYVLRFLPNALSVTRIAGSEQVWGGAFQNAAFLDFQADGNLVAYLEDHKTAVWNSETQGNPGSVLAIQPDGNLVIYRLTAVWSWQTGIIPPAALTR